MVGLVIESSSFEEAQATFLRYLVFTMFYGGIFGVFVTRVFLVVGILSRRTSLMMWSLIRLIGVVIEVKLPLVGLNGLKTLTLLLYNVL